jgi:hypothetical protein
MSETPIGAVDSEPIAVFQFGRVDGDTRQQQHVIAEFERMFGKECPLQAIELLGFSWEVAFADVVLDAAVGLNSHRGIPGWGFGSFVQPHMCQPATKTSSARRKDSGASAGGKVTAPRAIRRTHTLAPCRVAPNSCRIWPSGVKPPDAANVARRGRVHGQAGGSRTHKRVAAADEASRGEHAMRFEAPRTDRDFLSRNRPEQSKQSAHVPKRHLNQHPGDAADAAKNGKDRGPIRVVQDQHVERQSRRHADS